MDEQDNNQELIEQKCKEILKQRYKECNDKGHPGYDEDGHCTNCYRRATYNTPEADAEAEFSSQMKDSFFNCCGADEMLTHSSNFGADEEMKQLEIMPQKYEDRLYGLRKIKEELEGKQDTDSIDDALN